MSSYLLIHRLHIIDTISDAIESHMYILTTDSNGQASVSFSPPLEAEPGVVPAIQGGTANQDVIVESATVNGFTVRVLQRASLTILGVNVLSSDTTNVEGAKVAVWVA